jgi:hypothetical protein
MDQIVRSSTHIYASKEPSVIRRRRGAVQKQSFTPKRVRPGAVSHTDVAQSADVYYRDAATRESPQALRQAPQKKAAPVRQLSATEFLFHTTQEVVVGMPKVYEAVREGLRVSVICTDEHALQVARLQKDFAVTRQTLTEDQGRDIAFTLAAKPQPVSVAPPVVEEPPQPVAETVVEEPPVVEEPTAEVAVEEPVLESTDEDTDDEDDSDDSDEDEEDVEAASQEDDEYSEN